MSIRSRSYLPKKPSELQLNCEPLESRRMLAGNVTISQNAAGDFTIKGDGQSNFVAISADSNGHLFIQGANTIVRYNGVSSNAHLIPLSTAYTLPRHLKIRSGGGDDIIAVDRLTIRNNVDASLGSGDDSIVLSDVTIGDRIKMKGGGGADRLDLFSVDVTGKSSLTLNAQSNSDSDLDGISILSSTFGDESIVVGSSRDDHVVIESSQFAAEFLLKTSGNNDVVIFNENIFQDSVIIDLGAGDDTIDLEETTFAKSSDFKMGRDNDLINFFPLVTFEGDASFDGNNGLDAVFGVPPIFLGPPPVYASIELGI